MMTETPIQPSHIEDTLRIIAKLHAAHREDAGRLQRFVDKLTEWVGRPHFAALLTGVVALWIGGNLALSALGAPPWDAPPFNWLQGSLALTALYVTIFILTTQRRDDQLAGYREQLILELAIQNEQKSAKIISLLEEMRHDLPDLPNRHDQKAASMSVPADSQAVRNAIKETGDVLLANEPRREPGQAGA